MAQTFLLVGLASDWLKQQTMSLIDPNDCRKAPSLPGQAIAQQSGRELPVFDQSVNLACDWNTFINNPDVKLLEEKNSIGIDDIRAISSLVARRPYQSKHTVVIIAKAETMTFQAQNAFLKLLEEPPSYAQLILWASTQDSLLETVRSRCFLIKQSTPNTDIESLPPVVPQFWQSSVGQRFQLILSEANDKAKAQAFINTLLVAIRDQMAEQGSPRQKLAKTAHQLIEYQALLDKAVNPKFVAEQAALLLPVIARSDVHRAVAIASDIE